MAGSRETIVNTLLILPFHSCCSYPAVLVVPHHVSDDSILRVAKNHRHMRFPVATWKNRENKAVLLRSSAIERSSVASIIRTGVAASGGSTDAIRSSNVEQDKYLSSVGKSRWSNKPVFPSIISPAAGEKN